SYTHHSLTYHSRSPSRERLHNRDRDGSRDVEERRALREENSALRSQVALFEESLGRLERAQSSDTLPEHLERAQSSDTLPEEILGYLERTQSST
ncbi:4538_t:CDS:2, partial [Scutellospora calospora]